MRVTSGGVPVAFFDVDANSALVFPRRVADLPTPAWPAGGPYGVWIVNNQCSGDNCHLTGFIAQEHRQICTGALFAELNLQCSDAFLGVFRLDASCRLLWGDKIFDVVAAFDAEGRRRFLTLELREGAAA